MNSAFRRNDGSTPYRLSRHSGFPITPIFPVIPAKAGIYALRWTPACARATDPHHTDFPVIPGKAGIHALRWTPLFARATDPHHSSSPSLRFPRHSGESRNLHAAMDSGFRRSNGSTPYRFSPSFQFPRHSEFFPSFRRKPESTRYDGLRFSPERRIHTIPVSPSFRRKPESIRRGGHREHWPNLPTTVIPAKAGIYTLQWTPAFAGATDPHHTDFPRHSSFPVIPNSSRHSGESRNLRATMASAFRQSDGSTPFQFPRHSGESRNLFAAVDTESTGLTCPQPSFRLSPESTRHDELRFSPAQRIHTIPAFPSSRFSRHSDSPVIPVKAGIYAPRWTPLFARATAPHLNRLIKKRYPVTLAHTHFAPRPVCWML